MRKSWCALCALLTLWHMNTAVGSDAQVVRLTSLEWAPYTGEKLPELGTSSQLIEAAFEAVGYKLEIEFLPWNRAIDYAKNNPNYDGYFPEYFSESLKKDFLFSEPIGEGPLILVEKKSAPVVWNTLSDLWPKRLGVVNGFVNTEALDADIAQKKFPNLEIAIDDVTNLKKVYKGRLDLAVIDVNVMHHLLKTEPILAGASDALQVNSKILENKKLYICFRRDARGQKLAALLQEGLKKIEARVK